MERLAVCKHNCQKMNTPPIHLPELLLVLEEAAPLRGAAEWDNVGLLIEPREPAKFGVRRVLLTIDLTDAVAEDASRMGAEVVIAYHPSLFRPLSRLSWKEPIQRAVLRLVAEGRVLYSPHTALDQAMGGVNDWLASCAGQGRTERPLDAAGSPGFARLRVLDRPCTLQEVVATLSERASAGGWRTALAEGAESSIARVGVCAGAGASALRGVDADVWVTGEMGHHDLLAARERGITVLMSEHTRTERGFLPIWAARLRAALPGVEIIIAPSDACPVSAL